MGSPKHNQEGKKKNPESHSGDVQIINAHAQFRYLSGSSYVHNRSSTSLIFALWQSGHFFQRTHTHFQPTYAIRDTLPTPFKQHPKDIMSCTSQLIPGKLLNSMLRRRTFLNNGSQNTCGRAHKTYTITLPDVHDSPPMLCNCSLTL
ncbi:hypothetical protein KC19_4G259500 [Ceratodon purpureus]|uniref:Uncharacterized protein n=1 Tax=Ceratodon purpureus TaxID=3225 RepID=A0A8T0IEU5_CERPU|nr:hypothetical protein KC19_4G259500 [Ceratodon purpureus]